MNTKDLFADWQETLIRKIDQKLYGQLAEEDWSRETGVSLFSHLSGL